MILDRRSDERAIAMGPALEAFFGGHLARQAAWDEIAVCLDHVRDTGDRAQAFEDVFWALVNSAEFIHRK